MDHYKETVATWNKLADLYEERFMDLTIYNPSYDFVCETLSAGENEVLEVGCGPGMIARYLLNKRPDLIYLGTDVSENMVELAQKNNPQANFKVLDCREIFSLHKQFNAVLSGFCIPYLAGEDVKQFVTDCKNVLHPDGLLYLSFIPGPSSMSGYQTGTSGDRVYFYYHEEETLLRVLDANGFSVVERFSIPYERANGQKEKHLVLIARL